MCAGGCASNPLPSPPPCCLPSPLPDTSPSRPPAALLPPLLHSSLPHKDAARCALSPPLPAPPASSADAPSPLIPAWLGGLGGAAAREAAQPVQGPRAAWLAGIGYQARPVRQRVRGGGLTLPLLPDRGELGQGPAPPTVVPACLPCLVHPGAVPTCCRCLLVLVPPGTHRQPDHQGALALLPSTGGKQTQGTGHRVQTFKAMWQFGKGYGRWGLMVGSVFTHIYQDVVWEGWQQAAPDAGGEATRSPAIPLQCNAGSRSQFQGPSGGGSLRPRGGACLHHRTSCPVCLPPLHSSGIGDFWINGASNIGNERVFHHYAAPLNAIPLAQHFMRWARLAVDAA
ncbi:uncharacterized protein HaLaN_31074, partial [Haematococcus lacustris]